MKKSVTTRTGLITSTITALLLLIATSAVTADDTEIFLKQAALPAEQLRPNVVFILDTSGSMGLPVETTTARRELSQYDSSVVYQGFANNSGGMGDEDYVYLYLRPNTYADQLIYFNKVHDNQMTCNMSTLDDTSPYKITRVTYNYGDRYVYETGTSWLALGTSSNQMCAEHEASCAFAPGPAGPLVDCKSEENYITPDYRYASDSANNNLIAVSANFHNFLQSYYRYTVLQTVMRDLIDEDYDINMTLMRFNGTNGGYVVHESILAEDQDDATNGNQASLRGAIDDIFNFSGGTPLTEVLWESYLYLKGAGAFYGDDSGTATVSGAYSSGTTYNSPIDYECQKSHIILLTDGAPSPGDNGRDNTIASASYTGSPCSGNCLDEFAGWIRTDGINNRDHSGLDLIQDIKVHTIGFGAATDVALLTNTAVNGGGDYRSASSAADLLAALKETAGQTLFEKDTFVAPAVAVNAYSGLQHRNELYFALFQPTATPRWSGNIKKYKLQNGKIMDSSGTPIEAVNEVTGYFDKNSLSYWTTPTNWDSSDNDGDGDNSDPEPDGNNIGYGGIAYELTSPSTRNLFTYIGAPLVNGGTTPASYTLSAGPLKDSNANITTELLGLGASDVDSELERTALITWARGGDAATPPLNYFVGDFIHNRPSVVTYNTTTTVTADGEKTTVFDDTVFAASNVGFLHAIDTSDGSEEFAFIPQELLANLSVYFQDSGTFSDKVYGLDAPMKIWRNDVNKNGSIVGSTDAGDHVYIYQGMRRGGSHIYAIDATIRTNPKLLWQIDGMAYDATPSGDYRDLAQTWSVPQIATIKTWGCTPSSTEDISCDKTVLFFGGGYDTVHDDALVPTTGDKGNALYMVDATTGALLWSAGNGGHHDLNLTDMQNSIPSEVTVSDVDGDGYADLLFAVDIQGNVWRMDFAATPSNAATFAYGGKIAELGGSGGNFRRFFNAPDIAYFTERGSAPFLTVSIASGYRASPNETAVNDHLFVLYDKHALYRPVNVDGDPEYNYIGGSNTIAKTDMSDASNILSQPTQYGWYLPLSGTGEKGLSRTVTFGDKILMTTFLPSIAESCEGAEGSGRYYLLNALTGTTEFDGGVPFLNLTDGGIPPEPAVIFTNEEVCVENCNDGDATNDVKEERTELVVCVGTECFDDVLDQTIQKSYWREN